MSAQACFVLGASNPWRHRFKCASRRGGPPAAAGCVCARHPPCPAPPHLHHVRCHFPVSPELSRLLRNRLAPLPVQGPGDRSFIAVGEEEGAISLWDLTEAEETHEARAPEALGGFCLRGPTFSTERRAPGRLLPWCPLASRAPAALGEGGVLSILECPPLRIMTGNCPGSASLLHPSNGFPSLSETTPSVVSAPRLCSEPLALRSASKVVRLAPSAGLSQGDDDSCVFSMLSLDEWGCVSQWDVVKAQTPLAAGAFAMGESGLRFGGRVRMELARAGVSYSAVRASAGAGAATFPSPAGPLSPSSPLSLSAGRQGGAWGAGAGGELGLEAFDLCLLSGEGARTLCPGPRAALR